MVCFCLAQVDWTKFYLKEAVELEFFCLHKKKTWIKNFLSHTHHNFCLNFFFFIIILFQLVAFLLSGSLWQWLLSPLDYLWCVLLLITNFNSQLIICAGMIYRPDHKIHTKSAQPLTLKKHVLSESFLLQ